mgnify:FL=1|jgi:hypothetical protein
MDQIEEVARAIMGFNVSRKEKETCAKKLALTIKIKSLKGELEEGQPLFMRQGTDYISLVKEDRTPVFTYQFESLIRGPLAKTEIEALLAETEVSFQKDIKARPDLNVIGLHKHPTLSDAWCNFNARELIHQITKFKDTYEKLILKDCEVRTCKINGRKYKRITFTNEMLTQVSFIESAFGRSIKGCSYLILPEKWAEIKDEVISLVDFQETTYGSKTRLDSDGKEYKIKH